MAALHSALHSLAPVNFSDVPEAADELDHYLTDLYSQSQTIVESIPIGDPDEVQTRPRAKTTSSLASNASEMSSSSARSEPPPPHIASLQKEWGKPLKLKSSENVLGISVYKTSGKDSKGAWFARRSVHEGLGFARFKAAFEKEFPTSLAVQGAPGEGNVRGIGAESRVEQVDVPNRGKMEVYRLSAQFPGPTTPRDFVTFLATSSKALKHHPEHGQVPELTPRHYMIISKPCNHPETQPGNGFIRGQYESVEFIREVPRRLKASASQTNLSQPGHGHHKHSHDMAQDVLIRNAEKIHSPGLHDGDHDDSQLSARRLSSRDTSPSGRRRSHTVDAPESSSRGSRDGFEYDPEENPVEWIMVTRSDPGGSVPRFLVERGTPASICADAVKFLDWACQQDEEVQSPNTSTKPPMAFRRESFTSFENEQRMAGITELDETSRQVSHEPGHQIPQSVSTSQPSTSDQPLLTPPDSAASGSSGIMASVAGVLSAYVPNTVSDHFSGATPKASPLANPVSGSGKHQADGLTISKPLDDDAASTISSISWASADSHMPSDPEPAAESISSLPNSLSSDPPSNKQHEQHEKELQKLAQRKAALDAKFAQQREKLNKQNETATEKEKTALKKAEDKHERELKKHQDRHQREIQKIDDRKKKEAQKLEAKKRKQADKDEKDKLRRERDEAVQRLQVLEEERGVWRKQVGELQNENTALMVRIGKLETARIEGGESRSRSNSVLRQKKRDEGETRSQNS